MKLSDRELFRLRDILRGSIGIHAESFTKEELKELGTCLLQVTATVLKAKHAASVQLKGTVIE